ncbi:hypothetical protein K435DRAFT_654220 [Dendrothele bispora CBS 962.96]|uniref:2OGFeDO JBP1/TET oxygenase domain-containing protein n=1 Tax=Dendrothele bispora (strain CBS 962.96) TaxID=1314807 RepID=A0A4S8MHD7_DENBC|nr:hypothetical protein K435DRAFT_654220 [Dendrothele bispora CBS 962.96]
MRSSSKIIRDSNGLPLAVLGPRPNGQNWSDTVDRVSTLLENARRDMHVNKEASHRHGKYASLHTGISLGGGQTQPCNLAPSSPQDARILEELQANDDIAKIIDYCNYLFQTYFPKLHALYRNVLQSVLSDNPSLKPNFPNNHFASATYNLARAVTVAHRDFLNLFFGQCCIFACGNYNWKTGGHIVLWDLGLVIEFPPGAVVFIPSALLLHSNTKILATETCSSITLYSAAALFRWVHNGGMTDLEFRKNASPELMKEWEQHRKELNRTAMDILRDD